MKIKKFYIEIYKWGFWFRVFGYGVSFSTLDTFSIRYGYKGRINQILQKRFGFHINLLKP